MTDRRCYTPEEFAESRKISIRTVYRLIKAGKIRGIERVGRQYRIWTKIPPPPDTTRHDMPTPS
jgi:excisionase family DNA binding protein